ncbi:MAG: cytochrome c family protein [Alphaproteobacteria bacterium]|nr:cytochrome c family protein [Alphaproteobacteria bacterium]
MSSFEKNKIIAALLTGGLIAMVSGQIAKHLVQPHYTEKPAIELPETVTAQKDAAPKVIEPISPLLAKADVTAGEALSKKCLSCHSFEKGGPNKVGPNLWNIVGNKHGHAADFPYSKAISSIDKPWNYEELNIFLASPKDYAPGTKMSFPGFKKTEDRVNIIGWLRSLSDNPQPLPESK